MKSFKKNASILLSLIFILTIFTACGDDTAAYVITFSAEEDFTFSEGTITGYVGSGGIVSIPDTIGGISVTNIRNLAFNDCDSLVSVTIPDSVLTIGFKAFSDCTSLVSVVIPDSVTNIGGYAFDHCTSLSNVTVLPTTPPTLGSDEVFERNASGRKIYVPVGSLDIYKTTGDWINYADNITNS